MKSQTISIPNVSLALGLILAVWTAYAPLAVAYDVHDTHYGHDPRGVFLNCNNCHQMHNGDNECGPLLIDCQVCNGCHSPNGAYDGVNDPIIGARNYWRSGGVYQQPDRTELLPGLENWCAGCHDNGSSVCEGAAAPNVMGDNATHGYNITGHKITCTVCHDVTKKHIREDYSSYTRTYSHSSNPWNADDPYNYQNGYRLTYRMIIPLGIGPLGGYAQDRFALCFTCHDYDRLMGNTAPYQTNFQDDGINRHLSHLSTPRTAWDSDWDYLNVPDEIIVDNTSAQFVCDWPSASTVPGYYGTDYQMHDPGIGSCTVTWTPQVPETREYTVYVRWPASSTFAGDAVFTVMYNGGTFITAVDQRTAGGRWNLLGTFPFVQGTSGYVQLSDSATGTVIADAIKLGDSILDSRISCPACHNVHGSPTPAMIRHGALISTPGTKNKEPALSYRWYKADGLTPAIFGDESCFGDIPALGGPGGGSLEDSKVCVGCHGGPMPIKYDRIYQTLPVPQGAWARPPLPPSVRSLDPRPSSQDVAVDKTLSFMLLSNGSDDFNWTTLSVSLTGDQSYSKAYTYGDNALEVTPIPARPQCYQVSVDPNVNFGDLETITVMLSVQDLAGHGLTSPEWSFKAGTSSPVIWRSPVAPYAEYTFWSPELLIDDQPDTANPEIPFGYHWTVYDLGQSWPVGRIRLLLSNINGRPWTISVSDDPNSFGTAVKANWLAEPDVPSTIIDNPEATFIDDWPASTSPWGYYGTDCQIHTTTAGEATATCTWTLEVAASGSYQVYARWTSSSDRAQDAAYTITYDGGSQIRTVNQQINGSQWVHLGTYPFVSGNPGSVVLSNASATAGFYVVADAVRLVPEGSLPAWAATSFTPKQGRFLKIETGMGPLGKGTIREIDFAEP
ncbi:MAG: hypothetical protein ACMUIA_02590 [bacterium]